MPNTPMTLLIHTPYDLSQNIEAFSKLDTKTQRIGSEDESRSSSITD